MSKRRLIILVIGFVLLMLGVGLILYGNSLPSDLIVHGIWIYSNQAEYNTLMLIGFFPVCIGIAFLLFGLFTR